MPKNIYFWTMKRYEMRCVKFILPLLAVVICGCQKDVRPEPVEIRRLDIKLPAGEMPVDEEAFKAAELLFQVSGYGEFNDSSLAVYSRSHAISFHSAMIKEKYSDISGIESELGSVFGKMREYYPEISIPDVYSIISPFNQSVFTVDTLLYIGLNHYFGPDYEPYSYFPDYIRKTKMRERIAPDVTEALLRKQYGYKPVTDYPTALSRMLYEGALVDAVMKVTGLTEREVMCYDKEQMDWLEANEKKIWNELITRKLLYSTDEDVALRLVAPSAVTSILSPEAPGRAGRYMGYKIVKAYLKNNDVSDPADLLKSSFYDSANTLAASKYH